MQASRTAGGCQASAAVRAGRRRSAPGSRPARNLGEARWPELERGCLARAAARRKSNRRPRRSPPDRSAPESCAPHPRFAGRRARRRRPFNPLAGPGERDLDQAHVEAADDRLDQAERARARRRPVVDPVRRRLERRVVDLQTAHDQRQRQIPIAAVEHSEERVHAVDGSAQVGAPIAGEPRPALADIGRDPGALADRGRRPGRSVGARPEGLPRAVHDAVVDHGGAERADDAVPGRGLVRWPPFGPVEEVVLGAAHHGIVGRRRQEVAEVDIVVEDRIASLERREEGLEVAPEHGARRARVGADQLVQAAARERGLGAPVGELAAIARDEGHVGVVAEHPARLEDVDDRLGGPLLLVGQHDPPSPVRRRARP